MFRIDAVCEKCRRGVVKCSYSRVTETDRDRQGERMVMMAQGLTHRDSITDCPAIYHVLCFQSHQYVAYCISTNALAMLASVSPQIRKIYLG